MNSTNVREEHLSGHSDDTNSIYVTDTRLKVLSLVAIIFKIRTPEDRQNEKHQVCVSKKKEN